MRATSLRETRHSCPQADVLNFAEGSKAETPWATVIAIPKAGDLKHLEANRAALNLELTGEDLAAIDAEFPPPSRKTRLAML